MDAGEIRRELSAPEGELVDRGTYALPAVMCQEGCAYLGSGVFAQGSTP